MDIILNKIHSVFKWSYKDCFKAIIGTFLFAIAINLFIVPNKLYNGGILGISQLLRSLLITLFNINSTIDISGIINLILNIPLFFLAYKYISKTFFFRTMVCLVFQTLFLTIIPVPAKPILDELITCVLIGGIIGGFGGGMTLSASGSGGGTDIIGIVMSMKSRRFSVGKIGLGINAVIYIICGLLFGIPIALYSIIYSAIYNIVVDNTHDQNICSYVMIFTKEFPEKIINFIKEDLDRDVTFWEGSGGYDKSKTFISYAALSKYEVQRLERHLNELDKDAFMIKNEGISIDGNFKKYLT